MRSIPQAFYKSTEWKRCRDSYMSYVGGLCERCKARGLIVPAVIVHHKVHLTDANYQNPEMSLSFSNLEALCKDCHNQEHFGCEIERRYTVVDGQIVMRGE